MVSASKHYFEGKDGLLKYQKKDFEVALGTIGDKDRSHMVTLSLRDHCSAIFYAEIAFGPELPDVYAFLRRAWSPKPDHVLQGLPVLLTVPESVERAFPGLSSNIDRLGVEVLSVTSGFQGGVRDIHTIESSLGMAIGKKTDEARAWLMTSLRFNGTQKARTGVGSKAELWTNGVPPLKALPANWPNAA
jgi:hypothetical protein